MKMKYLVPAFLAVSLVSGAAFSSDAFARSHSDGQGHNNSGYSHNGGGYGNMGYGYGHKGGGCGNKGGGNHYGKNGMHSGYNLNAEDRAAYDTMRNKHQEKMQPLMDEHFVKNQELQALQNAANPNVAAINKASNELVDIRKKLGQESQVFNDSVNKKFESN